MTGAIVRGDLRRSAAGQHVVVSMGRYCLIGEGSVLRPPGKIYKGAFTFYPVRIADYVHIGPDCIVEAASLGLGVEIGARSIIVSIRPGSGLMSRASSQSSKILHKSCLTVWFRTGLLFQA